MVKGRDLVQEIQWYTPDERREQYIDTYPLRQKGKSTGQAETPPGGQARPRDTQIIRRAARPSQRGKQRPHPGGQRPSPSRAPTRASRRAGIGQGDLPHTKVTTSSSRMQGDRKDQHSSHSLNQWKERFDL